MHCKLLPRWDSKSKLRSQLVKSLTDQRAKWISVVLALSQVWQRCRLSWTQQRRGSGRWRPSTWGTWRTSERTRRIAPSSKTWKTKRSGGWSWTASRTKSRTSWSRWDQRRSRSQRVHLVLTFVFWGEHILCRVRWQPCCTDSSVVWVLSCFDPGKKWRSLGCFFLFFFWQQAFKFVRWTGIYSAAMFLVVKPDPAVVLCGPGRFLRCLLYNFHLFVSCGRLGEPPVLTVSQASVKFRVLPPEGPE